MNKSKKFSGVYTALITPFAEDDSLDWASLERLVEFQLRNHVQGFVVLGTTSESPCLSASERKEIFQFVQRQVAGRVPLIVGTGTNCTQESVRLTREAMDWGAEAVMAVVPYYNKPPQRGLLQHFQKIAQVGLPVMLYNVPSRTITRIELDTIVELSKSPNIFAIKEASGDLDFGRSIVQATRMLTESVAGDSFLLTSGDDATAFDLMRGGARGVVSVASHILPSEFVHWCRSACEGGEDWRAEFTPYLKLIQYLFSEANPIPVKMALHLMGVISSPHLRLPLVRLSPDKTEQLKTLMQERKMVNA